MARLDGDDVEFRLEPGADPLTESTRFDVGSVTKTFAGLLLATMVESGEVDLDAPAARAMTFRQLVTHTSGLPRLPPNLMAKAELTPDDPYRDYTPDDLAEAVATTDVTSGAFEYSNFGFMVLGAALADAGGASFPELLRTRVLEPLGLDDTGLGWDGVTDRAHGHVDGQPVPDWTLQVPGPGGLTSTIADMVRYLRAHLDPGSTPLAPALELVQQQPLAWQRADGVLWHNGGAGGFAACVAFDRAAGRAAAVLTNAEHSPAVDQFAFDTVRRA